MKLIFTFLFVLISGLSVCGQNNSEKMGDNCFVKGDYDCAIKNYNNAVGMLKGENKQTVEIKLSKAQYCKKCLKEANIAFGSLNYQKAKENYQNVFDENPNDPYARKQLEKIEERKSTTTTLNHDKLPLRKATTKELEDIWANKYGVNPERRMKLIEEGIDPDDAQRRITAGEGKPKIEITLSTSIQNISARASGDKFIIDVKTNVSSFEIKYLPSWCKVTEYSSWFTLNCEDNNTSSTRSDWFWVVAGDKYVIITVTQEGNENTLTVSTTNISFPQSGGDYRFDVYTDADEYSVSYLSTWCFEKLKTKTGFTLYCIPNKTGATRTDWFKVKAGNKEVRIYVTQYSSGTTNARNTNPKMNSNKADDVYYNGSVAKKTKSRENNNCFNCPKTRDAILIKSALISDSDEDKGHQFGVLYEHLFKYGFGIRSGFLIEAFPNFWESDPQVLYLPIHLEYRLNFAKIFSIFGYGGLGLNLVPNVSGYPLPTTFDYGCGLQLSIVQINYGKNSQISNTRVHDNGRKLPLYKKTDIGISIMIPLRK